jgi:hypothetical protein
VRRGRKEALPVVGIARLTPSLTFLVSIMGLMLPVGILVASVIDAMVAYGGAFPLTTLVLYLVWLLVALTLGLLITTVVEWRHGARSLAWRVYQSGVALTAIGFCVWLAAWNLLGPRW